MRKGCASSTTGRPGKQDKRPNLKLVKVPVTIRRSSSSLFKNLFDVIEG